MNDAIVPSPHVYDIHGYMPFASPGTLLIKGSKAVLKIITCLQIMKMVFLIEALLVNRLESKSFANT
jgi:hypothetical protein